MNPPPKSLEDLLEHAAWVRELARRLVRDESRREDVVQATWVAALTATPARIGDLRAWFASVMRNVARQQHRGEASRRSRERAAARGERTPATADLVAEAELSKRLVEQVLSLEEPYRETLLLRYFKGRNAEEIARLEGVPASTVRNRLRRGLERLREKLDREHGDRKSWALVLTSFFDPERSSVAPATGLLGGLVMNTKLALWSGCLAAVGVTAFVLSRGPDEDRSGALPGLEAENPRAAAELAVSEPWIDARDDASRVPEALPAVENEPEPAGTLRYRARVVDPHGVGIPGARVTIVDIPVIDARWTSTGIFTFTDDEGTFELAPTREPERDVNVFLMGDLGFELGRSHTVNLACEAAGFAPSIVELGPFEDAEAPRVILERATAVHGLVVWRDTQAPVEGCSISFEDLDWLDGALRETRTDVAGGFRFERAPAAGEILVTIRPANCKSTRRRVTCAPGGASLRVELERGLSLRGRVVELPGGRPIADATLHAAFEDVARTAVDGTFELRGLAADDRELEAGAPGFGTTRITIEPGSEQPVEVPLLRECRLNGRLTEHDGTPVTSARIVLLPDRELDGTEARAALPEPVPEGVLFSRFSSLHSTRSDREGRFRLEGLSPYVNYGRLTAIDPRTGRTARLEGVRFDEPGEERDVTLAFADDSGELHGTITQAGEPLRASLTWISSSSRGEGESKEDGTYRLTGVEPGPVELRVLADDTGYSGRHPLTVLPSEATLFDLAIDTPRSFLAGRARTESGAAFSGYWIYAQGETDPGMRNQVLPEEDGSFRIPVSAHEGERFSLRMNLGLVTVTHAGAEAGSSDLDLVVPEMRPLRLDVRGPDGALQEIDLAWRRDGEGDWVAIWPSLLTFTEADGFTLELPLGRHDLRVSHPQGALAPRELEGVEVLPTASETPLVVSLAAG